jgi:hypothetical protein
MHSLIRFNQILLVILTIFAVSQTTATAQMETLECPASVQFLNRTSEPVEGRYTVRSGEILLEDITGNQTPSPLGSLDGANSSTYTGDVETILGAPVFVISKQSILIPQSLRDVSGMIVAAAQEQYTYFVKSRRLPISSESPAPLSKIATMESRFIVCRQQLGQLEEIGAFSFQDNVYNQYLSEVWPVSSSVLAIVTRSNRHPKLNTLFLFDVTKRKVVGMREFSVFQYLPATASVWIAQSVANCDNIEEVFAEARSKAQVFQLFDDKGISRDFQALDGIEGDVARQAESGSTNDASSASLRIESPQPVKQAPEANLTRPAPSEEPVSSTLWSIVVVLIVAACGLLWLLLKGRK